jgi:hypothetical protein
VVDFLFRSVLAGLSPRPHPPNQLCVGGFGRGDDDISRAAMTAHPEKQTYQSLKSEITSSIGDLDA